MARLRGVLRGTAATAGRGSQRAGRFHQASQTRDAAPDSHSLEASLTASDSSPDGNSHPPMVLTDNLIHLISGSVESSEPPRKKQRVIAPEPELPHIIVNRSTWDIPCISSHLAQLSLPISKTDILKYVSHRGARAREYIEIHDEKKQTIFHAVLPPQRTHKDVHLALLVDQQSKKWANAEGRLWTEIGVSLLHRDGGYYLQMVFTIKWNLTSSPYHVPGFPLKTKALSQVLDRYFPGSNGKLEKWSPQDFYESVHTPDSDDPIAASMQIENLKADLYPFQKRAVQWLLRNEGVEWSGKGITKSSLPSQNPLPISFQAATDSTGQPCFVSHLFGVVTLNTDPFSHEKMQLKGGILAEEMGLGKTVEMISLISLHKRGLGDSAPVYDVFTDSNIRPTGATLIIAPQSILMQWISEIKRHAPQLKVTHYEGIPAHRNMDSRELLDLLATSDVVISTYNVLTAEIHFTALNPTKTLRNVSKYPRPKSPLMMLSWWRCVMDEAQMIETGVNQAAVVARLIPRINAWCVTGTPIRKDVSDVLGLLVFLRCEPYASIKHVWSSLISSHKSDFKKLLGGLALRHNKRNVRDELKLPSQRRYVITMPFTPIEEQHYQELFTQMCTELGVDSQGAPILETWDPEAAAEAMRGWLVRLRQTALHPEVGDRNRRALGKSDGPLRTIDQVLEVMIEQSDIAIRADQRALLTAKLKRGQLFENSPRVKEALTIWEEVVHESAVVVQECRDLMEQERHVSQVPASKDNPLSSLVTDDADKDEEIDPSSRLGKFRLRLRGALEVQHMAIFFRANAYFQIKSNEEWTPPYSPEFSALEELEVGGYEEAKKLRQEILQEILRKADRHMKTILQKASTQEFVEIPEFPTDIPRGGIESRRILERLDELAATLDSQANQLDEWREQTIQLLLRPLVDEDEGVEIKGDEYEESTKTQDEVLVYVQALRSVIADRHETLTGQTNLLIENEAKTSLKLANEGDGPFPERIIQLLGMRSQLKSDKSIGSVRGLVSELRALTSTLKFDAESGTSRAQNELTLAEKGLQTVQKQLSEQLKVVVVLEKEIELFTSAMNTRVEYYRQLQQISDMVGLYDGINDERTLAKMIRDEERLSTKIAASKSKRRYLEHLKMESSDPQEQRICVICREEFEIGALTVCGHTYCKECIGLWWHSHHNCPVCKRKLVQADLHAITYKPQELSLHTEEPQGVTNGKSQSEVKSSKSAIYSEISKQTLAEIKNIELDGPSFTTKVDTLARHLIWLRESDPGAKSIIFSQFKDFLDVLAQAFQKFRINFSSIDKPNGIEKFKEDPSVECFLLHARAHSSGLNLVNASHVFLTEPLLNTALELQAIARVDRIGQQQETNVWVYLVAGTVEESIHSLSVRRRMEHIDRRLSSGQGKGKKKDDGEIGDGDLEEANSLELQRMEMGGLLDKGGKGGEMVRKDDLWECLFGGTGKEGGRERDIEDLRMDLEVGRELRAGAAEGREGGLS